MLVDSYLQVFCRIVKLIGIACVVCILAGCQSTPTSISLPLKTPPVDTPIVQATQTATKPSATVTPPLAVPTFTLTPSNTPTISAKALDRGSYLAYWVEAKGGLYVTDVTHSFDILLAPIDDQSAKLSPDAARIAFDRNDKLYVYDLLINEIIPVQQSVALIKSAAPEWSPDGKALLYLGATIGEEFPSIYITYLDTGETSRLTPWKTVEDDPAWSPNGKWIAFASDQPNAARTDGVFVGLTELYLTPADCLADPVTCSTLARQVTDMGVNSYAGQPAWSPDSQRIAFACQDDLETPVGICILDIASGKITRLTNINLDSDDSDTRPAWSVDGQYIAFMRAGRFDNDLYIVAAEGGDPTNITNTPDLEEWFTFWINVK